MSNYNSFGYALAMRVLQSDLYHILEDKERVECDALIERGQSKRWSDTDLQDIFGGLHVRNPD